MVCKTTGSSGALPRAPTRPSETGGCYGVIFSPGRAKPCSGAPARQGLPSIGPMS